MSITERPPTQSVPLHSVHIERRYSDEDGGAGMGFCLACGEDMGEAKPASWMDPDSLDLTPREAIAIYGRGSPEHHLAIRLAGSKH